MSLLGLKPWIVPPVAYTLCQLFCPVSIHRELDFLFISHALELKQLSQCSNLLQYERFGVQIPVGARIFAPFQTGPKGHPASPTMGNAVLS